MSDAPLFSGSSRWPHSTICSLGDRCSTTFLHNGQAPNITSAAWPSANRAFLIPFVIDGPFTAVRMFWYNGTTASGNVDAGLYDAVGTRLASTGSTAQSGTSALQSAALTASVRLAPGLYYLALALNGTTGHIFRCAPAYSPFHYAGAASAFALPATLTPVAAGYDYVPTVGVSSRSIP